MICESCKTPNHRSEDCDYKNRGDNCTCQHRETEYITIDLSKLMENYFKDHEIPFNILPAIDSKFRITGADST